jgi:uncharacterized phiE125 gp8 family phage protein
VRFVRLTTATGAQEPVSLADLKAYGRIVSTDEDRILEQLLLSARQSVERYSGHILVPGTFRVLHDTWAQVFELPLTPVRSVTSITYHRTDGTSDAPDAATYFADLTARPSRVAFYNRYTRPYWLRGSAGIDIEVVAGYEKRSDVPEDVRLHVMRVALLGYEHRDDPDVMDRVDAYVGNGCSPFAIVTV